ncbi:TniQ family protein [Sporosarcina sp. YIM B06819]|uniref:TniQ family protein n=1 Tax=Sporosarcina sp. YIM B06819 TaxID=3081769 RepID=UPI00298D5725|nr:TniQ family protein [Sporosarcina sp. YIM B06819]
MLTLWNDENIKGPERSICYPLEPMCKESIDVESLTSYIQRISEAHSVSVSSLVRHLIFPTSYTEETLGYSDNDLYRVYYKSYSINGFNQQALFFLEVLRELTDRIDLKDLTWMKLSSLLSLGDIKVVRHWCPACIYDQKNEEIAYEKLVWSLKSVTICLKHNCFLESTCPACKKENKQLDLHSTIGYCSKCKTWLGSNLVINNNTCEENTDWQKWVYKNVEGLMKSEMQEIINRDVILDEVSNFLTKNFNPANNSIYNLAYNMGFNRAVILQWKNKSKKVSFESLLILSFCVNISIEKILLKENEISISRNQIRPIKKGLFNKKSFIRLSIDEKRIALNEFINSDEYPPLKLGDVTKKIGYKSNESLREFFPDECRLISARYKAYKAKEKSEQVKKIKQEISECASSAFKEGEPLNKLYIMNKVKIGRQFINREIIEHINKVLEGNLKGFH